MRNVRGGIRSFAAFAWLAFIPLVHPAWAQGIAVAPVNVQMGPGEMAAVLTVANQGDRETSFQIRAFGWQQNQTGDDQLAPTDELLASPPIATLAPGATQIVRLVLRRPPEKREATYRILFDQLTPPAEAGRVHVALRLSIPVFAEPSDRLTPHVQWRIVNQDGQAWLLAVNGGSRHQTVRNVQIETADGGSSKIIIKAPPHILAGGQQRWRIEPSGPLPPPGTTVRLTGGADVGQIDERIKIDAEP